MLACSITLPITLAIMAVKEMATIWSGGKISEATFCFWLELVMAYVDQAS
ncbi:hypothetical protein Pint_09162 [Pistacia integerrima]|uniref:Uncharacterized protein n=1 Tax=Pistacia integerrima TaxID=434235 RepID=A0ACC0XSS5_9ROSI|nr:hypothetical protein Pint_09162 [Pistacia integerrima]